MLKTWVPAIAGALTFLPAAGHACAVCFGGADGNLIKGFTWGVAVLGLLPFILLAGLITLVARASKKYKPHE